MELLPLNKLLVIWIINLSANCWLMIRLTDIRSMLKYIGTYRVLVFCLLTCVVSVAQVQYPFFGHKFGCYMCLYGKS